MSAGWLAAAIVLWVAAAGPALASAKFWLEGYEADAAPALSVVLVFGLLGAVCIGIAS